ncbi:MAG: GAF domain-containing SpoIIE family protein phosphatase [Planctomycetota bacterium]
MTGPDDQHAPEFTPALPPVLSEAAPLAPDEPWSVRDFLTDGALAAMCARLADVSGLDIQLRDEHGSQILASGDSDAPWRMASSDEDRGIDPAATRVPIYTDGDTIGELILAPGEPSSGTRENLVEALGHLAQAAGELCDDVVQLRGRLAELRVIYELSSLLAGGVTKLKPMLGVMLDSALRVLELDAGSIVLFPEDADGVPTTNDEGELVQEASRGLSNTWLDNPLPLSENRCFDQIVLSGEVLAIEHLASDPRVIEPGRVRDERLASFVSAAMVSRGRPIGVIRLYSRTPRRFGEAERRLVRSIGDQAATGVQQVRLLEVQKRERHRDRQLLLAGQVQGRMLPAKLPDLQGITVDARSVPTDELGGDFYDVELTEEGLVTLLVGDVVGKGVPAAMLMASLLASLRASAPHVHEIDAWIGVVNDAMCRTTLPNEFATMWCGRLDPRTLRLTYTSAGHEPPLVIRPPRDGSRPTPDDVYPLGVGGLVLGVMEDQTYPRYVHQLHPGDVLIAHSDGLTDARNFDDERWGYDRMVEAILDGFPQYPNNGDGPTAHELVEHILWSLRRFSGLRKQVDDETLLVMRLDW